MQIEMVSFSEVIVLDTFCILGRHKIRHLNDELIIQAHKYIFLYVAPSQD